jgi:imidazole glycerol phosphate synthase glutamine amidotransferase subunit
MKIEILDLGTNNISSIYKSVYECMGDEDEISVITDSIQSYSPDLIILPGLGHFKTGMKNLRTKKFDNLVKGHVGSGGWIAGICLGMQLLCDVSEEAPGISGLGIINASVKKLPPEERVPNIGWNSTSKTIDTHHFSSLDSQRDFYFVHSFFVEPENKEIVLSVTPFAQQEFVSSFLSDRILGVQFHPEKSGKVGRDFMREMILWSAQ